MLFSQATNGECHSYWSQQQNVMIALKKYMLFIRHDVCYMQLVTVVIIVKWYFHVHPMCHYDPLSQAIVSFSEKMPYFNRIRHKEKVRTYLFLRRFIFEITSHVKRSKYKCSNERPKLLWKSLNMNFCHRCSFQSQFSTVIAYPSSFKGALQQFNSDFCSKIQSHPYIGGIKLSLISDL